MAPSNARKAEQDLSTRLLHAGHHLVTRPEVAPAISVSTTFRAPSPAEILAAAPGHYTTEWDPSTPSRDIYSRYTQPVLTQAEAVLSSVIGQPTIAYPSGIAATFAILLHVLPDVIAITDGYHGCHASIEVYRKTRGEDRVSVIKLDDAYPKDKKLLVWLETPLNPTGECRSIEAYFKKTHAAGGTMAVDSTFAPPPLQDPFKWGADIVMHSGTKYFGGHSDLLCGTVSVKDKQSWLNVSREVLKGARMTTFAQLTPNMVSQSQLWHNRTYTGSNEGSLESWLLLRSLRTLAVRVPRQARTATALAQWLASLTRAAPNSSLDGPSGVVGHVWHVSLQKDAKDFIGEGKQMTIGSACFAFMTTEESYAVHLGHALRLFVPATSLGSVESLIEQRVMSDPGSDPRLLRLSIGLEDFDDLKRDLIEGFHKVLAIEKGLTSSKL